MNYLVDLHVDFLYIPMSKKENTVITKGVPIDANDTDITNDIKATDGGAIVERLFKGGKKRRALKIKFSSVSFYQKAISSSINLPSVYLLCHAEALK